MNCVSPPSSNKKALREKGLHKRERNALMTKSMFYYYDVILRIFVSRHQEAAAFKREKEEQEAKLVSTWSLPVIIS